MAKMFSICEEQESQIDSWKSSLPDMDKPCGAIGGRFSYIFTPTSLGIILTVKDNISQEELDLTAYTSW